MRFSLLFGPKYHAGYARKGAQTPSLAFLRTAIYVQGIVKRQ